MVQPGPDARLFQQQCLGLHFFMRAMAWPLSTLAIKNAGLECLAKTPSSLCMAEIAAMKILL